ncbi:VWA domain-containing protein [Agromyces sp. CFH 90414]|uniref:VWA domain-containing protein n=1 Tax=Agromyces agglutinans TaxID=2662258 RepID=A0A6I2F651_9MICO|nr:substrate-binding domain-containing protein [Agromyces agglutinans]MRG60945.1 VWA domain-containing protein [Agromyces agglutinans]
MARRGAIIGIAAGAAVIALLVTVGIVWIGNTGGSEPAAASGASCEETEQLVVVVDPSIATAVGVIADRLRSPASGEDCLDAQVVTQASADSVAQIAAGAFDGDAWIPGSSVWVERLAALTSFMGQSMPEIDNRGSIAVSPVVLGVPEKHADAVEVEPVTWARVRDRQLPTILPDPEASAASVAGLYAVRSVSSTADPRQFAGAMMALGKQIPASTEAAIASALTAETPTAVILTEVEIVEHNRDNPDDRLVAEYPGDASVALEYPFVAMPVSDDEAGQARARLVTAFERALRVDANPIVEAGLRRPDGSGTLTNAGGVMAVLPFADDALATLLKAQEIGAAQLDILRLWGTMTLRSRMLAVIDVSGSMEEPAGNGLRRIDIFQQAAGGALGQMSGEVELGVWLFSTARAGEQDWEEAAPIAPLVDSAHTAQVMQVVGSLPARLGGATGLYDTTLAAVQRVREGYDPEMVNSVLLITDGKNEDENGIDLDTLIAKLNEQADPAKPVPVILVGFGPDTDLGAMQRIAEATGGAAYTAHRPEDLSAVLVDALFQRGCRPDCG